MSEVGGKVALVTGGGRGIGKAVALALADAGLDVAVNYRTREEEALAVAKGVEQRGRRALAVQADVADAAQVAAMVGRVREALGPIAVLINNAGSAQLQKWEDITAADWHAVVNNNLTSAFLVTQAVLPEMKARRWGRIVMISSGAVRTGGVVGVHYTAAKAGMEGLMRAYAKAVVTDGVTVNAVAPALIDTEMRTGDRATRERMIPMGRLGTAEETAEAVLLLVRTGYMTGQTVHLNGGMYYT
jgi:3-oxoacyl-[acyl-carrier protein] reductase